MTPALRVGIVAGEASGDLLATGLIEAIKARCPDAVFEGIAGPGMQAGGAHSLFPMERLSVMGIAEVLGRYRELVGMRRKLIVHFQRTRPDIFIGVDAPDFNLGLEQALHQSGIKTAHYVSPSVWAWRQWRVKQIARSTDLMLTLFPFEAAFYQVHGVPVRFVGHPLAEMIPMESDRCAARRALGLAEQGEVVALLPGSRSNEIRYLGDSFLGAAQWCLRQRPGLRFVAPMANASVRHQFEALMRRSGVDIPLLLVDGRSREVMAAADVVLLASGTATLEAALLKRPMVVAYRVAPLTAWIARRLLKVSQFSLPNLLAGEALVPELIQDAATPEALGRAVMAYLDDPAKAQALQARFAEIHHALRHNANEQAADAVLALVGR